MLPCREFLVWNVVFVPAVKTNSILISSQSKFLTHRANENKAQFITIKKINSKSIEIYQFQILSLAKIHRNLLS